MSIKLLQNIGLGLSILRECMRCYRRLATGREQLDLAVFANDLRETGLTILFRLTLVAAVVGLIIGKQTEMLLANVNLPEAVLAVINLSILREFGPLLVGLFVAGRSGVGLVVRIGSMILNRETDGLIICGIHPVDYIVAPMLLAMLLMSFVLAVWTDIIVVSVTGSWLWWHGGISWTLFVDSLNHSVDTGDLILGVIKPMVFSVFIGLIAAVNGCNVSRQIDSVSRAATRTMISAIAAILFVDLLFILIAGD